MTQILSSGVANGVASTLRVILAVFFLGAVSTHSLLAKTEHAKVFVTEIRGVISVKERVKHVALLESLDIGAVIHLSESARLVAFYSDSAVEYHVHGPASYKVAADALLPVGQAPLPIKKGLHAAYRGVKVQENSLVQAGIVLRATGKQDDGMRPANEKVDPALMRFQWRGNLVSGTRIELHDDQDALVWTSLAVAPPISLPTGIQLVPGKTYRWQLVAPNTKSARRPWAEFEVLTAEIAERIRSARPAINAPASEHVAFALLLNNLPAPSMAEDIWAELAAQHPETSALLKNSQK